MHTDAHAHRYIHYMQINMYTQTHTDTGMYAMHRYTHTHRYMHTQIHAEIHTDAHAHRYTTRK